MHDCTILNALIDKSERHTSLKQRVFLRFDKGEYEPYNTQDAGVKRDISDALDRLKEKGFVDYHWMPYMENVQLDKAWLISGAIPKCYEYLGRRPKDELIRSLTAWLCALEGQLKASWMKEVVHATGILLETRGSQAPWLKGADIGQMEKLLREVDRLIENVPQRRFSVRAFGNSKVFERDCRSRLLAFCRESPTFSETVSDDDLLEKLGICQNPTILEFCGPIRLMTVEKWLDCARFSMGTAIVSEAISSIADVDLSRIERIISIENRTSYYDYIHRKKLPGDLVLYSAGFVGPSRLQLFKLVMGGHQPFFHWGDIDLGGFEIFLQLRGTVEHLQPMMMDVPTLLRYRKVAEPCDDVYIAKLRKVLEHAAYRPFHETILFMLREKVRLEQEHIY